MLLSDLIWLEDDWFINFSDCSWLRLDSLIVFMGLDPNPLAAPNSLLSIWTGGDLDSF